MRNDDGTELLERSGNMTGLLEALTTTNMLLTQMALDIGVIVQVVRSAVVEPVAKADNELSDDVPYRDRLLDAGIGQLDAIPLTISGIKEIGLSNDEAVELARYRDRALKARRQIHES